MDGEIVQDGSMKRVLIYLLCAAIVVAAIFVFMFLRPDIAAKVFSERLPRR